MRLAIKLLSKLRKVQIQAKSIDNESAAKTGNKETDRRILIKPMGEDNGERICFIKNEYMKEKQGNIRGQLSWRKPVHNDELHIFP